VVTKLCSHPLKKATKKPPMQVNIVKRNVGTFSPIAPDMAADS